MASNIDIVRAGYESFCRGDVQTMRAMFAVDIEWRDRDTADSASGGVCRGRDAVLRKAFAPVPESHDELELQVLEFRADGDAVVVTGVFLVAGSDGSARELPFVHVCTVRDGRIDSLRPRAHADDDAAPDRERGTGPPGGQAQGGLPRAA